MRENETAVFTVRDAARILGKTGAYASKFLHNRQGIERIEGGRYCIEGTPIDVVASHMVHPSYLSLISALRFYNLTAQIPAERYVVTTARHLPAVFRGNRMRFIKVSKRLMFGFGSVNGAVVATPEKAFIDALYLKRAMWYTEEFKNGVDRGVIDMKRLKGYALALGNKKLIGRLADFLEESYSVDCSDLRARGSHYAVRRTAGSPKHKNVIL